MKQFRLKLLVPREYTIDAFDMDSAAREAKRLAQQLSTPRAHDAAVLQSVELISEFKQGDDNEPTSTLPTKAT